MERTEKFEARSRLHVCQMINCRWRFFHPKRIIINLKTSRRFQGSSILPGSATTKCCSNFSIRQSSLNTSQISSQKILQHNLSFLCLLENMLLIQDASFYFPSRNLRLFKANIDSVSVRFFGSIIWVGSVNSKL